MFDSSTTTDETTSVVSDNTKSMSPAHDSPASANETAGVAMTDLLSTPGEILEEEFLSPLGISHYRLAKSIGVSQSAISDIIHGRRAITARMSLLLGMALGTGPHFWMNLQSTYDLKKAEAEGIPTIEPLIRKNA
ncbi:HigA family addiction module antidote protein [Bifidobacterium lemurum]|uniref:HigA family addiction module antidote protein n=1 Tax=Bifidobacterium lemurum TaxID=1603886 RepID=A0A261FRB5_9BIFI|nr:HigA family addiction module antitoxin [Bifidobacterium lemurum]OZG61346.1 HigA family addiction module antidote protein [Bifidobacterium lemurum]